MNLQQRINGIVSQTCKYPQNIDEYTILRKIGKGTFGTVYQAKCKPTNDTVAIKSMSISHLKRKHCLLRAISEIELHYAVSNSKQPMAHIVPLLTAFAIKDHIYMVMEYCNFNTLDMYLKKAENGRLSEHSARKIFKQLLNAIKFLHKANIIHRDLKLQNLLLTTSKPSHSKQNASLQSSQMSQQSEGSANGGKDGTKPKQKPKSSLHLKIGDFGLAAQITEQEPDRRTMCGTPNYVAPEIASQQAHSFPADIFSCGVILYTLLTGKPPFQTGNVQTTLQNVTKKKVVIPDYVSEDCKDLLSKLLIKNPKNRFNIPDILRHKWMRTHSSQPKVAAPADTKDAASSSNAVESSQKSDHAQMAVKSDQNQKSTTLPTIANHSIDSTQDGSRAKEPTSSTTQVADPVAEEINCDNKESVAEVSELSQSHVEAKQSEDIEAEKVLVENNAARTASNRSDMPTVTDVKHSRVEVKKRAGLDNISFDGIASTVRRKYFAKNKTSIVMDPKKRVCKLCYNKGVIVMILYYNFEKRTNSISVIENLNECASLQVENTGKSSANVTSTFKCTDDCCTGKAPSSCLHVSEINENYLDLNDQLLWHAVNKDSSIIVCGVENFEQLPKKYHKYYVLISRMVSMVRNHYPIVFLSIAQPSQESHSDNEAVRNKYDYCVLFRNGNCCLHFKKLSDAEPAMETINYVSENDLFQFNCRGKERQEISMMDVENLKDVSMKHYIGDFFELMQECHKAKSLNKTMIQKIGFVETQFSFGQVEVIKENPNYQVEMKSQEIAV